MFCVFFTTQYSFLHISLKKSHKPVAF